MDPNDLRVLLPGERGIPERQHRLMHDTPPALDATDADSSGLDCLVRLIRHYNALDPHHEPTKEEEENPIFAYAWQDFTPISGAGQDEVTMQRKNAKRRLIQQLGTVVGDGKTFESYAFSSLMNRAFWSSDAWALPGTKLGFTKDKTWEEIGTFPLDYLNTVEGGSDSLIRYDCRQDATLELQAAVDRHFEPRKDSRGTWRATAIFGRKVSFVRVLYLANEIEPRPMADLATFELPFVIAGTDDDGEPANEESRETLSLVAMVRMRKEQDSTDYIRTFLPGGIPGWFKGPPKPYVNNSWKVGDPGGQRYMLIYAAFDPPDDGISEISDASEASEPRETLDLQAILAKPVPEHQSPENPTGQPVVASCTCW
ncbi:X-pro dipeptidyl-peptidase [Fusarium albosuccineum]|uniref:X-pro dipeptidyl-peptidase n=1 Tax=Fusarium albosuccineum TaxID=1237068 RepID=A0A8H4LHN6_9HYPO|nr:X-pro dipeptidyl-peptidase [Fusarium albosuccineum]